MHGDATGFGKWSIYDPSRFFCTTSAYAEDANIDPATIATNGEAFMGITILFL